MVAAIGWFVGSVALYSHRTPTSMLLALPLALAFLGAIVVGFFCAFTDWRKYRWRSVLPLAACVVAFYSSDFLVAQIRNWIFAWCLPSYEAVVQQMEEGSIPVPPGFNRIPQAASKARLAYAVFAERTDSGGLMVEFFTERAFPVKHSGYLYISSGIIKPGSFIDSQWPIRSQVRRQWFSVSD